VEKPESGLGRNSKFSIKLIWKISRVTAPFSLILLIISGAVLPDDGSLSVVVISIFLLLFWLSMIPLIATSIILYNRARRALKYGHDPNSGLPISRDIL